jgi:UDP-3-O-[3-hydroxymyristoyl] glucosamine N-acyltransferase
MTFSAAEIAKHLEGQVVGDAAVSLGGFAPATHAKAGDLTFAETAEYFAAAEKSAASAILVSGDFPSSLKTLIRVKNARVAFAKVLPLFFPEAAFAPGVHPTAVVAASAQVDPSAHIGPHCVVGERAKIGPRVVLQAQDYVGDDSVLDEDTRLFPNVTVYHGIQIGKRVRIHAGTVVGSDGFGYVFEQGRHIKVPQVGTVIVRDDVELGANMTVDRGALGATIIGQGSKIDNLVQVAHNVVIGDHCIIVAQVGIAGSTRLGQYVTLGGQVGIAGHLKIGNQVTVAAQSGVMNSIPDGEKWFGAPAQPDKQTKRQMIAIMQLPDLFKRVRELEKRAEAGGEKPSGA